MDTVEIEGQQYEVTHYAADGLPVIRGYATSVEHKDEDGNQIFDEDGNPKVSVHISVSPPAEPLKENE